MTNAVLNLKVLGDELAQTINPRKMGMKITNGKLTLVTYETKAGKRQMLDEGYKKISYKELTFLCKTVLENVINQKGSHPILFKNPIQQIGRSLAGFKKHEIEKRKSFFGRCHRIFLRALQVLSFVGIITIPVGLKIGKKIQEEDPKQNKNSKYISKLYKIVTKKVTSSPSNKPAYARARGS